MKVLFKKIYDTPQVLEDDFTTTTLREEIEKTRQALSCAYAGFDYAVNPDMIDSYIYEINALQKRYKHLCELAIAKDATTEASLYEHSSISTLVGNVLS